MPTIHGLGVDDLGLAVFASRDDGNIGVDAEFAATIAAVTANVVNDVTTGDLGGRRIGHPDIGHVAASLEAFGDPIVWRDGKVRLSRYARAVFPSCAVPPFEPPP